MTLFSNLCLFLAEQGSGNGRGGNDEGVYAGVGHCAMKLLDEFIAQPKRFEIGSRRYLGAHVQARADVLAILFRMSWKPTGLLVVVCSFSPGNVVAGFFCLAEQRN